MAMEVYPQKIPAKSTSEIMDGESTVKWAALKSPGIRIGSEMHRLAAVCNFI